MNKKIQFELLTPDTYKVTDVQTGAVCTFTAGDFNNSQKWNTENVTFEAGASVALEMAKACRRVAEYVRTEHAELL